MSSYQSPPVARRMVGAQQKAATSLMPWAGTSAGLNVTVNNQFPAYTNMGVPPVPGFIVGFTAVSSATALVQLSFKEWDASTDITLGYWFGQIPTTPINVILPVPLAFIGGRNIGLGFPFSNTTAGGSNSPNLSKVYFIVSNTLES